MINNFKIYIFFILYFLPNNLALAFNFLDDFELGGGTNYLGGILLALLFFFGAFFGKKKTKLVIWGWILFFITFGFVLSLFSSKQEMSFFNILIALVAGGVICLFFMHLAEKENQKELLNYQKLYIKKKNKKKKKNK